MSEQSTQVAASGVEALIERLRQQGVARGQAEAEQIVTDAQQRADWIVEQAEQEAAQLRAQAQQACERMQAATQEALRIAARDTVLELKNTLLRRFSEDVRQLVAQALDEDTFVRQLILALAGQLRTRFALDQEPALQVLLTQQAVSLEALQSAPEAVEPGSLEAFVLHEADKLLRAGVTFGTEERGGAGIRLRLQERGVEIDLSEPAVAELLLQHLQPRFRALLEGVVGRPAE